VTIETISRPGEVATAVTPSEAVTAAITQWVAGLDLAMKGAAYVVDTPACPDSFWPLPAEVKVKDIPDRNPKLRLPDEDEESFQARRRVAIHTVGTVVEYGLTLGLPPEVALNGIFIIGGRYAMYAEQMVALVKSRGFGHRVVERGTDRCVVEVQRGAGQEWQPFEFTMEQAVIAGYVKGKGPNTGRNDWKGNDKYNTDPASMLYARASSIACKTVFPDVLRGLITVEEARDEQRTIAGEVVEATATDRPAPPRAAAALSAARPPAAPPADPAPVVGADRAATPQPDPHPLDPRQWDAINREFVRLEVVGDGQKASRLKVISAIVGREVTQGRELTADEGRLVLDNLAGEGGFRVVADALDAPAAEETSATAPDDGEQGDGQADDVDVEDPPGWDDTAGPALPGEEAGR
jgi:hypothetical protein